MMKKKGGDGEGRVACISTTKPFTCGKCSLPVNYYPIVDWCTCQNRGKFIVRHLNASNTHEKLIVTLGYTLRKGCIFSR